MIGTVLFFKLIIGHAFADFALQNDYVAKFKSPEIFSNEKGEHVYNPVWFWVMGAHALMHAGAVWAITGSGFLAACELVLHFCIDLAKCMGKINYHVDQALHFFCKWLYVMPW